MQNIPLFGPSADLISPPAATITSGYFPLQYLPAENLNYYLNGTTQAIQEISHSIELLGAATSSADLYQLEKAIIGLGTPLGFLVFSDTEETPVIWADARSSSNPTGPTYLPIIARTTTQTITTSQAPLLVPWKRDKKYKVIGVTDFTATVSGSVLTFSNTTTNNAFLNGIYQDCMVQRWLSSGQSPTYAASGPDYSRALCINVAGTDYLITAVDTSARTITVSGSPATGSQTVILYPSRIAGSTSSIKLPQLTGFVPAAAGDADGQYGGDMRVMDRFMAHWHSLDYRINGITQGAGTLADGINNGGTRGLFTDRVLGAITDGTNGTPRTGKTTDPRAFGAYIYTWAGYLIA